MAAAQLPTPPFRSTLIDVAAGAPSVAGTLDRVGMSGIELPVLLTGPDGVPSRVPASADVAVSLDDPEAKGIHMSRLLLLLEETLGKEVLALEALETMLRGFVASHHPISRSAFVELRFPLMLRRPALLSEHAGWRSYPVGVDASLQDGRFHCTLHVQVAYSSTCPCSAALARQHVRDCFLETFGAGPVEGADVARWLESPAGITATPHSQRSLADVSVELIDGASGIPLLALIDRLEETLRTPVQAAVKREDEQEFARLNGENPMFCEDAARLLQSTLRRCPEYARYEVGIRHQESLHPHDAVSRVAGG